MNGDFPDWEHVVPKRAKASIEFTEEDAEKLIDQLPKLPGSDGDNGFVRLMADGGVRIVAESGDGQCEALDLPNAKVTGRKLEIGFNRGFLIDGLEMRSRPFDIVGPDQPIVSRDERKSFLFIPLGEQEPQTKPQEKETAQQLVASIAEFEKGLKTCASDLKKRERLVKSTLSSLKELKDLAV